MINDIQKAVEVVANGGVILYLSDTIWGLGCDPRNEAAVDKLMKIKNRPSTKSFIVLIHEEAQLYDYVTKIPEMAWDLVEFAEDPLTVIYSGAKNLPTNVTAEDGSIGIRLVKTKPCLDLVKKFRFGLLSTSANLSGDPSPTSFSEINPAVLNAVDYVVNSQEDSKSKPSKIIKLGVDGEFKIIRK